MARESVKISRQTKTNLLLGLAQGFIKDKHHYGEIKRSLLDAQRHYTDVKNRRPSDSEA